MNSRCCNREVLKTFEESGGVFESVPGILCGRSELRVCHLAAAM